eukprot:Awhi_evm1s12856
MGPCISRKHVQQPLPEPEICIWSTDPRWEFEQPAPDESYEPRAPVAKSLNLFVVLHDYKAPKPYILSLTIGEKLQLLRGPNPDHLNRIVEHEDDMDILAGDEWCEVLKITTKEKGYIPWNCITPVQDPVT